MSSFVDIQLALGKFNGTDMVARKQYHKDWQIDEDQPEKWQSRAVQFLRANTSLSHGTAPAISATGNVQRCQ
jgi:hypothetical protein